MQAMLCIVDSRAMAEAYAVLSGDEARLFDTLMPGPLSLVVKARPGLLKTEHQGTVALRIPSHPVAHALVSAFQKPIVSTSANISGAPSPYTLADLQPVQSAVDLVIDGGALPQQSASTLARITDRVEIIRQGPITKEQILAALH